MACQLEVDVYAEAPFDALHQATLKQFTARGGRVNINTPTWIQHHFAMHFSFEYITMEMPGTGILRSIILAGEKQEILNVFLFPEPALKAPIFTMEFAHFDDGGDFARIDAYHLQHTGHHADAMENDFQLARLDNGLPPMSIQHPEWLHECRSGHDIYERCKDVREEAGLHDAYLELFSKTLDRWENAYPVDTPEAVCDQVQSLAIYKLHQRENSVCTPVLNRIFGEEWTHYMLCNYFFS